MKERQRDRLVGAMILASLAAIFLPMLFDGAGVERRPMPPMPVSGDALTETVEALDLSSETWDFVAETDARRAHETGGGVLGLPDHAPVTEAEFDAELASGPTLEADGTPRAWSVQVASFADMENAERLREQLLNDGLEAYITETRAEDRILYRVAVGPSLDPGAVRRLQADIAKRYELEGIVVRFVLSPPRDFNDDAG